MSYKICFRGDSRDPDEIFPHGFSRRMEAHPGKVLVHPKKGGTLLVTVDQYLAKYKGKKEDVGDQIIYRGARSLKAGDILPQTAVCVSARLTSATMFPLKFKNQPVALDSWIYVVIVKVDQLFNTHSKQVTHGIQALKELKKNGKTIDDSLAAQVLWPLFGHELAIKEVPDNQVYAAIKCRRHWYGGDFRDGGTYKLGELKKNARCSSDRVPETYLDAAKDFVWIELSEHRTGSMPRLPDAFKRSSKK